MAADTVPLGVAVQDVVPRDRVVVYSPSVDMSLPVHLPKKDLSWDKKVTALAAEAGLNVRDDGKVLIIGPTGSTADEEARRAWIESLTALPPETEPLKIVDAEDASGTAAREVSSALTSASPPPSAVAASGTSPLPSSPSSVPPSAVSPLPSAPSPEAVPVTTADVVTPSALPAEAPPAADAGSKKSPAFVPSEPSVSTTLERPTPPVLPLEAAPARPEATARLSEGTLMSRPTSDPGALRKAKETVKPLDTASGQSQKSAIAASSSATQLPLSEVIERIKPSGYRVVYASNVDRSLRTSLPATGDWQDRLAVVARANSLRIEETSGSLFVTAVEINPSGRAGLPAEQTVQPVVSPVATETALPPDTGPAAPAPAPSAVIPPEPVIIAATPPDERAPAVKAAVDQAAPPAPGMDEVVGDGAPPRPEPVDPSSGAAKGLWKADRGSSLHQVLAEWCKRAGVQLVWSSAFDFPLQASISLDDSFEGAVRTILSGFASAAPRPVGRLHRQANFGMRVLVIQTNGNRYGE